MGPPRKSAFARWYNKVADFNVEDLFSRKRSNIPPRTVYVNEKLPDDVYDAKGRVKKEHLYTSNQVITSKYTLITFLPRNLLEQFRRIANIFFLAIAILQFFNKFSTISPGLVILPLIIVIGITALKDGYEDIKRHQSDRTVNHTPIRILSGGPWENMNPMAAKSKTFVRGIIPQFRRVKKKVGSKGSQDVELEPVHHVEYDNEEEERDNASLQRTETHPYHYILGRHDDESKAHWRHGIWEDVRVGDIVKITDNEPIPADILICATSEEENVAFVETKNLDGETNLKSRNASPVLTHLRSARACADKRNAFHVDCESPDTNMYSVSAAITVDGQKSPVDLQMTLLRGTVLRNTKWVIGVVLYTGEDSKIVLNSGGTPSKRSKVERQMNPQVFVNLTILAAMAIACAIADSIIEQRLTPLGAPWLYSNDHPDDNPKINGLITWAFALITFQNIVPISLYISIEAVRTCQAAFIYFDKEIWYEKTNQATFARSWNLSDDLGQIEYIFSDKTGTLTQNVMIFRQCSINGRVYSGDDPSFADTEKFNAIGDAKTMDVRLSSAETSSAGASNGAKDVPDPMDATETELPVGVVQHFNDAKLKADLDAAHALSDDPSKINSEDAAHARQLNGFFSVLALCHSVLTSVDPVTGAIEYKAQSPDEAALVQAAADVGFVFRGRDREILRLQTPFSEEIEEYELLNILEFTSARKRMSVVLRKLDGEDSRLFLLSKGADNVIFERLKEGSQELKDATEKDLDMFAGEGLRTLTLAYKVIPEDEYEKWSERYHEAEVALEDRVEKIEAVCDVLERDLRLLGATAIEDRLQDGVPETIADLKRAGIKIWVATGDKLETAIAIGHSTNLIGSDSNVIVIRGGNQTGRPVYEQMVAAVEEFFPESGIVEEPVAHRPRRSTSSDRPVPLRRVNTGMSDIVGHGNGDRPGGFVLVVDGSALSHAFEDEKNKGLLLRLAMLCEGVICCRVSPLQKALIVKLVKEGVGAMTLAIGDGANDVSMIQAADVGVGISGEEGLQAVNSSDYAIGQFRFLKKLILVHGHWSYARNGTLISNFFAKNVLCIGVLWWFQIYDGWSSNYAFDYTYLLFWNSFWTIAPVIGIGLFDRIIDYHVLMDLPELYHFGREGTWFGMKIFSIYMIDAIYQSAVIFFLILYAYFPSPTARSDGWDIDLYEFSTTMVIAAVTGVNLFNGLNTAAWTWWVVFAVFIGTVLVWVFTAIYNIISPGWFATFTFGNNHFLFHSAYFWLSLPLVIIVSLAPRYLAKAYKFGYAPDDLDIMRYIRKTQPHRDVAAEAKEVTGVGNHGLAAMRRQPSFASGISQSHSRLASSRASSIIGNDRSAFDPRRMSRTDMSTGMRSVHRGFDFAEEENGVAMRRMQSNLSEVRNSSRNLPTSGEVNPRERTRRKGGQLSHVFSIRKRGLLKRKTVSRDQ